MPSNIPDDAIVIGFGSDEYSKGVAGSFDVQFFTDPTSGNFRFPAYTANWKGMVRLEDITNYKSDFLSGLDKKTKAKFSLDDFEYYFSQPTFLVEKFPRFIQRFPDACFNKGLNKTQVLFLFKEFLDFLAEPIALEENDETTPVDHKRYLPHEQVNEGLALGLLVAVGMPDPAKYWSYFTLTELQEVCTSHNIKPGSSKAITITRLIENNIAFSQAVVQPSELLKETYWSFIDLYVQDIREHIDHFHPLYFKYLWKDIKRYCDERGVRRRVEKILDQPYWTDRLYTSTKNYKLDDYD